MSKSRKIATLNPAPSAIEEVVEYLGGPTKLSRRFQQAGVQVSSQAIHKWLRNKKTPAKRVLLLEGFTERRWTRYELAPDLYPRDAAPVERIAA